MQQEKENKTQQDRFEEKTGNNFNKYYNKYQPKLIWFLKSILKDEDDAQDICNMAFMTSLEKIDYYNPNYAFSTWLFTIAKRLAIQKLKERSIFSSLEKENEEGYNISETLTSDDEQNYNPYKIDQKYEIIKNSIPYLDEKHKTVIEMREIQGMSYKDISQNLNLNLNTVKSQIKQGRRLLIDMTRQKFNDLDYADGIFINYDDFNTEFFSKEEKKM